MGWTVQQVCDWKPPAPEVLEGYYQAVRERARDFLTSLTSAQLEEERVIPPVTQPRTVAAALGQMTWDAIAHGGQIAYLRGLYRGAGWHR